jgi:hypothetical protein
VFDQQGLSLDQAPPIGVVLRFFLVGALWGVVAGIWLLVYGDGALDAPTPEALILTHLWTLGVMFSFMLGALFQMLPVLAGVAIQSPVVLAIRTQYPMMVGTLFLLIAFTNGSPLMYGLGAGLLLIGLIPAIGSILLRMSAIRDHSAASRGMGYATFNALIVLSLGVILVGVRGGWWEIEHYMQLRSAHIGYGILGWIALLIVSVSFQVVEMFYVTPPYPKTITRHLTRIVTWLLAGGLIAGAVWPAAQAPLTMLAMAGLFVHGAVTLRRFSQRKRPLTDATVWFWRIGSVALMTSMLSGMGSLGGGPAWSQSLSVLLFAAFAASIVLAMSYKIVPFLVWFHLNAQGYYTAPMMHEVIHPKYAKKHLWIHSATFFAGLLSLVFPPLWSLTGALTALSFGWLGIGIYRARSIYRHTERTGERIVMPTFR